MELSDLDVAESVLDLIGKTPMVQLKKIASDLPCPVVAKIETRPTTRRSRPHSDTTLEAAHWLGVKKKAQRESESCPYMTFGFKFAPSWLKLSQVRPKLGPALP